MFKLLKGGYCYIPEGIGIKDILIAYDRICRVEDHISGEGLWDVEVLDCTGKLICPGFIDQHVHITGGGGENGPASRIPEIKLSDITAAGVTAVVGVLGVDALTRNIEGLLAKAKALETEGITTYIYTGNYGVPTATLTGKAISDIAFIDKVIGIGEIAIADYRSSHPTLQMLREISFEAKVGGMVGGKAGIVHIHTGDGKEGILPLIEFIDHSDFPLEMFVPTHLNRNKKLFAQSVQYLKKGGNADFTAGEKTGAGLSVPDALVNLLGAGVDMEKVTISSDGNGSIPPGEGNGTGIGKVTELYEDIKTSIMERKLDIATVLKTVTSNVAKVLKLYPFKGCIRCGSSADILVINKNDFTIDKLLAKGEVMVLDGQVIKRGIYE